MTLEECYALLGAEQGTVLESLKRMYRARVMECHPDRNPGDKEAEEKFKTLTGVYKRILSETPGSEIVCHMCKGRGTVDELVGRSVVPKYETFACPLCWKHKALTT